MNFQIDIKPSNDGRIHQLNLYLDGYCYPVLIQSDYVEMMIRKSVVRQVKAHKRVEGKKIEVEHTDHTDSAGIKYTSKEYLLTETNP